MPQHTGGHQGGRGRLPAARRGGETTARGAPPPPPRPGSPPPPRGDGGGAGRYGCQGIRRVGLHRAEQHGRGARAEPSGGAAQAAVAAAGGASVCSPAPMLRPLVLLFAAAIAAAPASPAAAQQPRRTPPPPRPPPPATAPRIPTPRSVLGFEPGDDKKLAAWPTLVPYYQALASASDRVEYLALEHSTLGAPLIALVISSPQNLRALDRYRELNAKLADPRGFKTAKEAEDVLRGGKAIVLITSGIHSTDRKSTRLNSSHSQNLVCRLLLEKKKICT